MATSVATKRKWSVEQLHRNIHRINITLDGVGDEQRVLCQSDVHWDNPHANRERFTYHLDQAREHDAPVLDNGDFFCAMQGRFDPRSSKSDIRPEHQGGDYLDLLVTTAVDALLPYKDLLTVRGRGNHEDAIRKRTETDLTDRFVTWMRAKGAENIYTGGMSGFVVFNVQYRQTSRKPFKMAYFHGAGGGGPVTRGVIQTNRMAVYLPDADIIWTGHTHDDWEMPIARLRISHDCRDVYHDEQLHFRTSGYKEEYGDGYGGWHVGRGAAPKPNAAAWLVFRQTSYNTVECVRERAK